MNTTFRFSLFQIAATGLMIPLINCIAGTSPNIILIIGDDIGFSDIGCYGAEIDTPNLDRLGEQGIRFTQFYNMAKCDPTRSSLMTGLYLPRKNSNHSVPFPKLLQKAGYYTALSGKEHFNKWVPKQVYAINCFDDSFLFWAMNEYFIPSDGTFLNEFFLNGQKIRPDEMPVEDPPFYRTDVVTNYALQFLDKAEKAHKPFFLYLPYNAAHYPLQARPEDIEKYKGRYAAGWDSVRAKRYERQKALGIIDPDALLSPPEDNINKFRGPYQGNHYKYRPWESLAEDEKEYQELLMTVFAAMVDRMDQNIGRVMRKVEEMGALDNTLILFFSDNGSCPYDVAYRPPVPIGGPDCDERLNAAWANVGNTPYRFYKQYGHEGGARTHFIAWWPGKIKPGTSDAPAHLVDLYPTFLELAGAEYPMRFLEEATPVLDGSSLVPLFTGGSREEPEIIISGNTDRFRMVRFGDWKIVRVNGEPWELYNITSDPTELNNLAGKMPDKVLELESRFSEWQKH